MHAGTLEAMSASSPGTTHERLHTADIAAWNGEAR